MAADIDVPFVPSADQIRRREFASVRRGYDPDQVRDYLVQIAEQVEKLEQQLREVKLQEAGSGAPSAGAAPSEDPYERLSKRLAAVIATADREAEKVVKEAREESARLTTEARAEADRVRSEAQARADQARQASSELLEKAKAEADRVLLGLSSRRKELVKHLQEMQERLLGVAKELEVAIESRGSARSPAGSSPAAQAPVAQAPAAQAPAAQAPAAQAAGNAAAPAAKSEQASEDAVDSLEGMLEDGGIDLPDLPPLELDFEEDEK